MCCGSLSSLAAQLLESYSNFLLRTSATVSCLEALILEFHTLYLDLSSGEGTYVLPSYQQMRKKINRAIQSVSLKQISYFELLLTQ